MVDLKEDRLKLAQQLGADKVYLVKDEFTENENVENIRKLFDDRPEITIDACGFESTVSLAILVSFNLIWFL